MKEYIVNILEKRGNEWVTFDYMEIEANDKKEAVRIGCKLAVENEMFEGYKVTRIGKTTYTVIENGISRKMKSEVETELHDYY